MEAEKNIDGTISLISPVTGARKVFQRIDAGVSWGNPTSDEAVYSEHACVMVGLQDDDRINVLREFRGRMDEILTKLIEWKDLLYLTSVHAPPEPNGLWRLVQDADGLTRYVIVSRDGKGRASNTHGETLEKFPTFRGYDRVASLRKVPESLLDDVFGAHTLVDGLIKMGNVLVDFRYCHEIEKCASQPLNEVINQSINRAMVYGVYALWREGLNEGRQISTSHRTRTPWKEYRRDNGSSKKRR